jgi:hypothetical protein
LASPPPSPTIWPFLDLLQVPEDEIEPVMSLPVLASLGSTNGNVQVR